MIIVHSDREGFSNFDNIETLKVFGKYIHADMKSGQTKMIAVYKSSERASEVFAELLQKVCPESTDSEKVLPFMPFYDDGSYDEPYDANGMPSWYYMPEE